MRCLLVGAGRSGVRFVRALDYLADEGHGIALCGVVDVLRTRLEPFAQRDIPCYTTLADALSDRPYDLIIISTNERAHYWAFAHLRDAGLTDIWVICEKPLTATYEEAEQVAAWFQGDRVFLNFVERYSPISDYLRGWIAENGLTVRRANFFWGKYRVHDVRPTMGVLSEISHPLDLICWLADVSAEPTFNTDSTHLVSSNFSPHGNGQFDSAFVSFSFDNGLLVTGQSSFVWDRRDRRVQLYLGEPAGGIAYMATLTFDTPRWDVDELAIHELSRKGGVPVEIERYAVDPSDIDPRIFSVNKIRRLLERVVMSIRAGEPDDSLADLRQSLRVQALLDRIETEKRDKHIRAAPFASQARMTAAARTDEDRMLRDYLHGCGPREDHDFWDL